MAPAEKVVTSDITRHHHPAKHGVNPCVDRRPMLESPTDSILLYDRRAWRRHRERAARSGAVNFLHHQATDWLVERLDLLERPFPVTLDLGARDGVLSRALSERAGTECVVAAEPALGFLAKAPVRRIAADPELLPFRARSFDLVASVLALHWIGDLPGALVQIRRALKPGGLFLAAMFGGQTLVELRTVLLEAEMIEEGGGSPRVSPTVDLGDAASLLQRAGFAMPVADGEIVTVTYPDALSLMRELRGMGEANALAARRRTPLKRRTLARAAALYAERFGAADGRIPASFEILFLTARAPDDR